jgi:hypothetical protein
MSFLRGRRAQRPWERGHSGPMSASQEIFDSVLPATRAEDPFGIKGVVRMPRRVRSLLLIAVVPAIIVGIVWMVVPADVGSDVTASPATKPLSPSPGAPSGGPTPSEASSHLAPVTKDRRNYAMAVPDLDGLPAEVTPGTKVELWVAWDPPITKEPRVQRLMGDVLIEEVIPPLIPEAPATAILSVPTKGVPDLLFGDRYGALSVTMLPGER